MSFYLSHFIINGKTKILYIKYVICYGINLWEANYGGENIRAIERRNGIWFWKNVYHSRLNYFNGVLFNLHSCILSILIFIIPTNVDAFISIYFYFCRWKMKIRKTIEEINKTFDQITQVMQVAWVPLIGTIKNDDQYI